VSQIPKLLSSELLKSLSTSGLYSSLQSVLIVNLFEKKNYLQILYTYKLKTIDYIISFLEYKNYFEQCAEIRDMLYRYNKATGEALKLKATPN
jgi:hypothetical protein